MLRMNIRKKKNKKQKENIKKKICVKHKKYQKEENLPEGDKMLKRRRSDFSYS